MEPSLLIVVGISIVFVAILVPLIIRLLRVQSSNGRLQAEQAAQRQERSVLQQQLADRASEDNEAGDLRVQVAELKTELSAKGELLNTASASLEAQEQRRDELQARVQELVGSKAAMTEELKNEREALSSAKESLESTSDERDGFRTQLEQSRIREGNVNAELTATKKRLVEGEELLKQAKESFKVLSTQTLEQQQKSFMESADANLKEREAAVKKLVDPLRDQIERFGQQRAKSEGELANQIHSLAAETTGLSSALRRPEIRGQWGEVQLERVLELSGLRRDIDYTTQDSFTTDDGRHRTDVIVRMPHDRTVVLDSKVSLESLLNASATDDPDDKAMYLDRHVQDVKNHVRTLADKQYWQHLDQAPNVVVMVLPEFAFLAALEREPEIPEQALARNVIIVTPPAVLALLRAVELNWQQIKVAETAEAISRLGRDLHSDLVRYSDSLAQVGRGLRSAVNGYNSSVGTFQGRITPRSQRFRELGLQISSELNELPEVTTAVRDYQPLAAPEPDENGTALNGETNRVALPDEDQRTPDAALL